MAASHLLSPAIISYLASSATRAAIHRGMANKNNMADITAKSGSQSIASGLIGMGLGLLITTYVSIPFVNIWFIFAPISIYCTIKSLQPIELNTLSSKRAEILFNEYLNTSTILSISQVNENKPNTLINSFQSQFKKTSTLKYVCNLDQLSNITDKDLQLLQTYQFYPIVQDNVVYVLLSSDITIEQEIIAYFVAYQIRKKIHENLFHHDQVLKIIKDTNVRNQYY